MTQRTTVRAAIGIAALMAILCGCGGGSGGAAGGTTGGTGGTGTGGTPPPETIEGIATPSSVSVVTATNAQ